MPEADARIAVIAGRQRGVITRAQLVAAGLSRREIQLRVADGRLHRLHRAVYAVGHTALGPVARALAAVLACGPTAMLSHLSAAAAWGIVDEWPVIPQVTTGRVSGASPKNIDVHRARCLPQWTLRHGIRTTTAARALLDLAEVRHPRLERLIGQAEYLRVVSHPQLVAIATGSPGRRGTKRLLAAIEDGPAPTRSEFEDRLRRLAKDARLPMPDFNARAAGWEVDALWRAQRVVVECDSWGAHGGRIQFETDRRKDAALMRAGYAVLRVTWRRLRDEPMAVAVDLAVMLDRR